MSDVSHGDPTATITVLPYATFGDRWSQFDQPLHALNNTNCVPSPRTLWMKNKGGSKLRNWQLQWRKVDACYRMVEEYEEKHRFKFDYMARLRVDLYFFESVPSLHDLNLRPKEIYIPSQMAGTINDHLVYCRREDCAPYFTIWSDKYRDCNGTRDFGADDGNALLGSHMKHSNVTTQKYAFHYTIVRSCRESRESDECRRLKGTSDRFILDCNNLFERQRALCKKRWKAMKKGKWIQQIKQQ